MLERSPQWPRFMLNETNISNENQLAPHSHRTLKVLERSHQWPRSILIETNISNENQFAPHNHRTFKVL